MMVALPALFTPFIIIGGKVFGWFTATESACIAVLYAGALSIVVYREMNMKGLYTALLETGRLASVALFGAILPRLGLLISLPLLIIISSWASDEFSWKATLINAVVLTVMSWVIFVKGLALTIPVLPTIAGFGG